LTLFILALNFEWKDLRNINYNVWYARQPVSKGQNLTQKKKVHWWLWPDVGSG